MFFFLAMLMFMLYFVFMFVFLCHLYHLVLIVNIIELKDDLDYTIAYYCYVLNTFP